MSDKAWLSDDIAARQRALVDEQLKAMYIGVPPRHFAVIDEVLGVIVKNSIYPLTLLDAGCASAYYSEIIEHYYPGVFDYTGADFNDALLAMAKERYPDIKLVKRDMRALGLSENFYDVVLSGACLMHIRDWQDALGCIAKTAGRWLILHRTWVTDKDTDISIGNAYGHAAWYIRFNEQELLGLLPDFDLVRCWGDVEAGVDCHVNTYLLERKK